MKLQLIKDQPKKSGWQAFREELEAKWDKFWENPRPKNVVEREQSRRTIEVIDRFLAGEWALDLGCGEGLMTKHLLKRGMKVDAVDISKRALEKLQGVEGVNLFHEAAPRTCRDDHFYSLVLALDLIAELPSVQHRLFVSELARVLKKGGVAVVSTPLDISTDRAAEIFLGLMETEFDILDCLVSHDALSIKCGGWLKDSERLRSALESIGRLCLGDRASSHVIAVGRKKEIFKSAGDDPKA